MNYPPFKHFTLMEQTPTTASDSAAGKEMKVENHRLKTDYETLLNGSAQMVLKIESLQAEVAALKAHIQFFRGEVQRIANHKDTPTRIQSELITVINAALSPDKTA